MSIMRRPEAGVTLVELIVAIVIIGAAMAGLTAALTRTSRASADPVVMQQKIAIAETIMGEALLKPFNADAAPIVAGVRDSFNDVADFNGYGLKNGMPAYGITALDGSAVPGLASYAVVVDVAKPAAPVLGTVPANDTLVITVAVHHVSDTQAGDAFFLTGWRTRPPP